ncbi:hypothetical protein LCI18_007915 [Fusarium solani-melongenae]|uniref:Uncharacterized protein n=1 Tax=Fusarium solani subsp. cucurbitae TaxID=2747967 RepID=A0ACD3Z6X4_FUSSC|nr:hypothetical protein LCI18_007915 [Fusarium solani-melongenae]
MAQTSLAIYTDYKTRQTLEEPRKTFEDLRKTIPHILDKIRSLEIRTPNRAFNSSTAFSAAFQGTAAIALPLMVLELSLAIKRVGPKLEAIRGELTIANVAKVQGWERDGFGSHIYRFVRNEMEIHRHDGKQHYFYVWNPDTDWYQTFEEQCRKRPLPTTFGGYSTDLATVCLWMSRNRSTLKETTSYGSTAVFHLLVPAYVPIVIEDKIEFHDSLFPLVVTGQQHRGAEFVWFNWQPQHPSQLTLRYIGMLDTRLPQAIEFGFRTVCAGGFGFIGLGLGSIVFPPLAAGVIGCWNVAAAGGVVMAGGAIHESLTTKGYRILGQPMFLCSQLSVRPPETDIRTRRGIPGHHESATYNQQGFRQ